MCSAARDMYLLHMRTKAKEVRAPLECTFPHLNYMRESLFGQIELQVLLSMNNRLYAHKISA